MKILGLIQKNSGPGFHRIMMPCIEMIGEDCKITNAATKEDVEWCDAIFYNRETGSELLKYARELGRTIILDVDDYWKLDRHHIAYSQYEQTNFEAIQISHIDQADLVITTHERLLAKIKPYNERSIICHNSIPKNSYFATERIESPLPRIFWQGSITHEKDLELLRYPLKRLTNCAMIIAGYTKNESWDRMVSFFTTGLTKKGMVLEGKPPMSYYHNYSIADICVAPLLDTPFNGYKSNLKVLEAAHSSLPIVCSKVNPYLDLPVLYAEKQTDWFKHLNMLIHDSAAREYYGKLIHDYCEENFNFEKINKYRVEQIKQVINKVAA